jgi:hypothetical protein|tara:strand:- start:1409 stop:1912 length:504 start_codon:yes stop_codon:yes gene_type:complete
MSARHTLTFFGIEIDKSYFGKKPEGESHAESMMKSFSPTYRMEQAFGGDNYKQVNQYGEGSFKPYDVVPLKDFSGDMTLEYGLKVFNLSDFEKLYLGKEIKTNKGTYKIFGYKFPEDWENIGIKVIEESFSKPSFFGEKHPIYKFAIVENDIIQKIIRLKPVGIIIN